MWWWLDLLLGVAAGLLLAWLALIVALVIVRPRGGRWQEALRLLPDLLRLLPRLAADRSLPRGARIGLAALLAYLALPFDLIPDFIPVVGYADDAIIVAAVLRWVVRKAGIEAARRHWPGTGDGFAALCHLAGLVPGGAPGHPPYTQGPAAASLPPEAVLVTSPHAGGSRGLAAARQAVERLGIRITAQLDIRQLDELAAVTGGGRARLVIAAGGDGTVGSVADRLASTSAVLGILPLGTSNDFARSLGIPANPQRAAALLATGKISTVDLGRLRVPGQPARHFAHAATVGLNVSFARLATRASIRTHLGRFTYLAAASNALRERPSFECELHHDGRVEKLTLSQLSVINAPIFGGALGLSVAGCHPDDRLLDVLAIGDMPARRLFLVGLCLLLRIRREVAGVRALHVTSLHVHTERPLDVALDGEIAASLPGDFEVAGEALRVITPQDFEDIDD